MPRVNHSPIAAVAHRILSGEGNSGHAPSRFRPRRIESLGGGMARSCSFLVRGFRVSSVFVLVFTVIVSLAAPGAAGAADIARYQAPPPPPISADAVFVLDATTGTELFALNADQPLPPASLTKIVAAIVLLENANLDDMIEIQESDLVGEDQSQVGLVKGDRLSVRDLLVGMLVPSGNDATLALARYVGAKMLRPDASPVDAVAAFVDLMNDRARALGATATHFENPTGMDAPGHVMSARDVALLTSAALRLPVLEETVSTPSAALPSKILPDGYPVKTTNELLLTGEANGVKTGTTPNAGGCLVTSFAVGPNLVIVVVLGSDLTEASDGSQDNSARYDDTRALLAAVRDDYVWIDPAAPDNVAGLVDELSVWDAVVASDALLPVPRASATEVRYRLVLGPPASPEHLVGEVQFFVGERLLSSRPALEAA